MVLFAFVVPVVVIIMLATFVSRDTRPVAGSNLMSEEAIATRLRAVGRRRGEGCVQKPACCAPANRSLPRSARPATPPASPGAEVGDEAAWAPRIKTGYEALLNSALKGKGAIPAQGGGDFSDVEIGRAVVYMGQQGRREVQSPKGARGHGVRGRESKGSTRARARRRGSG